MRTGLPTLVLLACLCAPAHGQTCTKAPIPFLPGLFPETAQGFTLQFATDPTGGCTGMYRPAALSAREVTPWAVVAIEASPDPTLGETAESIEKRFSPPIYTLFTMADWPVAMRVAPMGDEFVTTKGSVRVTVTVKNGDQGERSRTLASALLGKILPKIPCG
jgi:hypothetical protein